MRRMWELAYVVLALCVWVWVAWDAFGFRLITYSPGADYWEHTAVLHALLENPWHPTHPLIVSQAGSPRFGPHFLWIALVSRAFGWDAVQAMSLAAVANTTLLLVGLWAFFRTYFREARAALYGLVIFFGSWLDAPHFSNVFKLKVYFSVAGYPSSSAFALTLLGLALAVRILRAELRHWLWLGLSALVWSYVYLTHPLTATMGLPAAVLLALGEPGVPRALRLKVAASVAVGFFLTLLWPYYPALGMVAGGTVDKVKSLEEATEPLHRFYSAEDLLDIFGFCLLAFPMLPYLWVRRQHVFVVTGALLMLTVFVGSALVPIPLGHRYVLLSVFFLQLVLVKLLLILTPGPSSEGWAARAWLRWPAAALVGALLVFCGVTNVTAARDHFEKTEQSARASEGKESVTLRYARRVGELAGEHAVVFSTALASWPLPTFGPKVVAPHHTNPLIPDSAERRRAAIRFFAPYSSVPERRAILERYQVTHVVAPPRTLPVVLTYLESTGKRQALPGGNLLFSVGVAASR